MTLEAIGDCAELGTSTGRTVDTDGDGILDGADRCPTQPAPGTADGCPPPENRPPIAVSDHWSVRAGDYVYDNALRNDRDPDGDRFTPRVTSISFRATEWSGMERDGTFNYMAGPGTRIRQRKVITYHLVDARGARSAPATMTIDVIPPGARGELTPARAAAARESSAAPRWYSTLDDRLVVLRRRLRPNRATASCPRAGAGAERRDAVDLASVAVRGGEGVRAGLRARRPRELRRQPRRRRA